MEQSAGVTESLSRTRMSKDLLETLCRLSCSPTPQVQQCLSLRMPQEIGEGDVVQVQAEFPMSVHGKEERTHRGSGRIHPHVNSVKRTQNLRIRGALGKTRPVGIHRNPGETWDFHRTENGRIGVISGPGGL